LSSWTSSSATDGCSFRARHYNRAMPLYQIILLALSILLGIGIFIFIITFINRVAKEEEATREKSGP
jgi:hypothetical protein